MKGQHLPKFLTRVVIRDGQPIDYEQLNRVMHERKFHRYIVDIDNTSYFLPPATYYSFGDLPAAEVKNLADEAAWAIGKPHFVITAGVIPGEVAWSLESVLTTVPKINDGAMTSPASSLPIPSNDLFEQIRQTMEKVKPLAETTTKVSSDFGQVLIKGCTTLNAGALIALPAIYKALAAGNAPPPRSIQNACILFAVGIVAGAFAGWAAFVFTSQTTRMLTRSLGMPMLKAQKSIFPDTMDTVQLSRLRKAEWSTRWIDGVGTLGLWLVSLASLLSVIMLTAGAFFASTAILSLTGQ